ncbi:2-oxoglutarate dehydrogenase complex dihydrolipoyllysine-residue succinyltransferase [Schlesneria paludicola]|uniref:2-oxoglutarate dehydrogenase complex dihydrolipoyllysine-residue succinyltransferase n=1 Tax=Schlesneria paludicola TaxID=360056 RepID=UPI00029B0B12|nr:2-oxoglutarate dehydrogenase complex dihydrolipoyllysine-residue succinyltransferase [Schlesneria paludicola]
MTVEVQLKKGDFGDSVSEVVVVEWLKQVGDAIAVDADLVELESDKATTKWPAPKAGVVTKLLFNAGDTIPLPAVIALIDETATAPTAPAAAAPAPAAAAATAKVSPSAEPRVMPSAAAMMSENGVKPSQVTPTGPGGRILKEDVQKQVSAAAAQPAPAPAPKPPVETVRTIVTGERSEKRQMMSPIRKRIASRLVEAQSTAALLTTFNEVDMTAIMDLRKQHQDAFTQRYGIKLGFMSFFVKAAIDALQTFPAINAEIQGTEIVYHNYFDIGIAIGGGKGLVVPVLRNAERMGFAQIEQAIAEFANKVKSNTLSPQELTGGTFTITNGGVYGSLLSTPIVNPPQSGVLGMHSIQDRPVARDGQVVIRPMMYLALTYDHRIVDGREAVTFLKRIKDCLENPVRLLLDV